MAKIALDVDGVLAEFTPGGIRGIVNRLWPGTMPADYMASDWMHSDILTPTQVSQIFKEIAKIDNFWLGLQPYSDNVGALASFLIGQRDHDVILCTARAPSAGMTTTKQTEMWIKACGLSEHHNSLNIVVVEHMSGKAAVYEALGVQYSVDDNAETVAQCQKLKNHRAALLDRSWNQDAAPSWRVSSVQEFLSAVTK